MKRAIFIIIFIFLLFGTASATTFPVCATESGYLRNTTDLPWATIRSATESTVFLNPQWGDASVTASLIDGEYAYLSRVALQFNTSDLPDNAVISSAVLDVPGSGKQNTLAIAPQFGITGWNPLIPGSLASGDFNRFTDVLYNSSNITYANYDIDDVWEKNQWTFNSNGISAINKTGFTTLMMRLTSDIDNAPSWESGNGTSYLMHVIDPGKGAKLTIEYTVPPSYPIPSFTSNVTSGFSPLSVQFNDTSVTDITGWNWSFTNVTPGNNTAVWWSQLQNATQIFGVGNFNIHLNVTNASGFNISTTDYWVNATAPYITADFTGTPRSGVAGTTVTFADSSTGYAPDNWTWDFGDGNTSVLQNPTNDYGYNGNFDVNLTVYNATVGFDSEVKVGYVTISDSGGLSGWNRQDILMEGVYTLQLDFQDSVTHSPIPVVTVLDSVGGNQTTATATFTGSYNYSVVVVYITSEGYVSTSRSYVMDQDRSATIYLTESPEPPSPPVLNVYTMHPVRIKVVDAWGTPLPHSAITVNYLASTLPSTDTTWLASAFGISTAVATEMTTSSLAMVGSTANDGALTFMMFPALTYGLTITNATIGLNNYQELSPRDTDYVIYCPLTSQGQVNNTLTAAVASSLPFYQLNASGGYNLSMIYQDTAGYTTNVRFQVIDYTAGSVLVYDHDLGNPGTGIITDNFTVLVPIGQEYIWQYNATKV